MAKLTITLRLLEMVLALPEGSVTEVQMDGRFLRVTVSGREYAPDAEVMAFQSLHDCEGERWYRTELTVPEPVARKVKAPS